MTFTIRTATPQDAEAILAIVEGIAAERVYTAISKPWPVEQQRRYLHSLSPREAIHVAESAGHGIIGYQVLELWASTLESMTHVGQIGTFLIPECRRQGVGASLFQHTLEFARDRNYRKFIVQVRSSNRSAQEFYRRSGFRECGRLTRQVRIDGQDDDEILMEFFL